MLADTRSKGQSLRSRTTKSVLSPLRSGGFIGVATKSGSFVSSDVLSRFAGKSETQSQQIQQEDFKGIDGLVNPLYDPTSLARHMEANTYHARAVRTKAQDVAGQGWELLPAVDNPSDEQRDRVIEFFASLDEDISETLIQAMTDRESIGWLSIEIVREEKEPDGPIVIVKNIPSHTMRAHQDGKRFVQKRGSRQVWFKAAGLVDIDVDKRTGHLHETGELEPEDRANEVMWNNIYTARSDVYGVPDHIPAVGAILGDIARRDYNIVFFENFGVPAYAVMISGDYDPGAPVDDNDKTQADIDAGATQSGPMKTPLHRQIEGHLQEIAANPHSVLLLGIPSSDGGDVKISFEKLAVEVKEASFRLYRMDNLKEVLSAHAVPPYRAGIAEQGSLGGNVAEQTDKIYRDSVLTPRQGMLERLLNRYVLGSMEITDWTFNLVAIDVEDELLELELAILLFTHGGLTPNDLIRNFGVRYGTEPSEDPAMDAHYINGIAIDAILTDDFEQVMLSLRDELLEIARKHDESSDEDGDVSAQLFAALAGLEASAAKTTADRIAAYKAASGRTTHSGTNGAGRTRESRARAARLGRDSARSALAVRRRRGADA